MEIHDIKMKYLDDFITISVTAQFLPGILDANLCKNKQTNN